ncbi:hypothetical protein QUB37_14520 [Microcoleus sp. AT3-A2]|uniref:hypothetical protein n=1 Tax=Microcoleus sp. AT3-A2 TaxID=2818610 RepID=UPI002FD1A2FC
MRATLYYYFDRDSNIFGKRAIGFFLRTPFAKNHGRGACSTKEEKRKSLQVLGELLDMPKVGSCQTEELLRYLES